MILKQIDGYPRYLIREDGQVFSLISNKFRKNQLDKDGYNHVNLCKKGEKPKTEKIHRLVANAFLEKAEEGKNQVNHIDGNKTNNHYTNLEWTNSSENLKHSFKIGLKKPTKIYGEKSCLSKLKEYQVKEIIKLTGIKTTKELSIIYNVSQGNIRTIQRFESWKHLMDK